MKDAFDSKAFFARHVQPHLGEIEALRSKAKRYRWITLVSLLLGAGFGIWCYFLLQPYSDSVRFSGYENYRRYLGGYTSLDVVVMVLTGLCLLTALGAYLFSSHPVEEFQALFKSRVLAELVKAMGPDFLYEPDKYIRESAYKASGIFDKDYDTYEGKNLISGRVGNTDFAFSELHTQYETTSTDSKGHSTTTQHTIFEGIFFHADFHKHFRGETFVLPDMAESLLGSWLGNKLQASFGSGELVKMEDTEFEKQFVVYGNDQQEARYILSPAMIERIHGLQKKFSEELYFSFVGERVYVAIFTGEDRLEADLFSPIDASLVEQFHAFLSLMVGIVDDLNLNTRIWTKE